MHRGRQLPPIQKTRDETTALLKELRSELSVLEASQKAADHEKNAQHVSQAKTAKKTKSVLAKRLLEQHRLQQQQRHLDEAVEHAARVHDFNAAMREQAAAHISRIIVQRDFVHSTLPTRLGAYAEHANLTLGAAGDLHREHDRHGSDLDKFRSGPAAVSIRKELGSMKTLLHELLGSASQRVGARQASASDAVSPTSAPHRATISQPEPERDDAVFRTAAAAHRPPDIDIELLQRKAEERLRRLQDEEFFRNRRAMLLKAGTLDKHETIVDGRLIQPDAEANLKPVMAFTSSASTAMSRSMVLAPSGATHDEKRELQIIAQKEKLGQALKEQRGYLSRLRERLNQLQVEEATPVAHPPSQAELRDPGRTDDEQTSDAAPTNCAPADATKNGDAGHSQAAANSTSGQPVEKKMANADSDPTVIRRDESGGGESRSASSVAVEYSKTQVDKSRRSRVEALRQLCSDMERRGDADGLATAQARLILALHREVHDAREVPNDMHAVATLLQNSCRAKLSSDFVFEISRLQNSAAVIIQNGMKIPGARERVRLRRKILARVRRFVAHAPLAVAAAVTLQSWCRGTRTRHPTYGTRIAVRVREFRQELTAVKQSEAATLIQVQFKGRVTRRTTASRLATRRIQLQEQRKASDAEFFAELNQGLWQ